MAIVRCQTVGEAARRGRRCSPRAASRARSRVAWVNSTALRIAADVRIRRPRAGVRARERHRQPPTLSGVVAREPGAVRVPVPGGRSGTGGGAAPCSARSLVADRPSRSPRALLYLFYLPFDAWWFLRFVAAGDPDRCFLLCADVVGWAAGALATHVRRASRPSCIVAGGACDPVHRSPRPAGHRATAKSATSKPALYVGVGDSPRRGHPDDAAQRQPPLLHRAVDRAVGRPESGLARSRRGLPARPGHRDLRAPRVLGRGRVPPAVRRPAAARRSWIAVPSRPRVPGRSASIR